MGSFYRQAGLQEEMLNCFHWERGVTLMVGLYREAKTLPEKVMIAGQDRTDSGQFFQG